MLRLLPILISSFALAAPDYDFEWATIGDVGNRAVTQAEGPALFDNNGNSVFGAVGSVDYAYRIATTEVTNTQYREFIRAYRPYWNDTPFSIRLTGQYINWNPATDDYDIRPGTENAGAKVTWHMAARYVNWLDNGKGTEQADFETGAYDTSTFGRDPDTNQLTDQLVRDADADFWIPNLSEWTKAMYWDPDKGSDGGYWLYHNGSDSPAIYDLPSNGGTSNGATMFQLDVGSYDAQSPWGLFDGSGGEAEMLETASPTRVFRGLAGSQWSGGPAASEDRIGNLGALSPEASLFGFRIASTVPAPGWPAIIVGGLLWCHQRRRDR